MIPSAGSMLNYEVTHYQNPETDSISIKVRTFDRGKKEGFVLKFTEEWILPHLFSVTEGEQYPSVWTALQRETRVPENPKELHNWIYSSITALQRQWENGNRDHVYKVLSMMPKAIAMTVSAGLAQERGFVNYIAQRVQD